MTLQKHCVSVQPLGRGKPTYLLVEGSMVVNGKLEAATDEPVKALKSVDFPGQASEPGLGAECHLHPPMFGSPTMPKRSCFVKSLYMAA